MRVAAVRLPRRTDHVVRAATLRRLSATRMTSTLAAFAVLASVWACGCGRPIMSARQAPDFRLRSLRGGVISLKDLRGKPSVINFWASWCMPCVEELPEFEELWHLYRGKVNFLAIATDDSPEEVGKFVREHHLTIAVVLDNGGEVARKFSFYGLPTTFFLTAEGKIVDTHSGFMSTPRLEKRIKALLGKA